MEQTQMEQLGKARDELRGKLDAKIPRADVRERKGSNNFTFSYLEGWYIIAHLNSVLGQGNWSYQTEDITCVHAGSVGEKFTANYIARVRLEAPILGHAIFSDVGYGNGSDKYDPGKPHELAAKEAVTDALKRCAKNLGMSCGLALYDKEQLNVEEDTRGAATAIKPNDGKGHIGGPTPVPPKGVGPANPSDNPPALPAPVAISSQPSPNKSRAEINKAITTYSRVVVAKRLKTVEEMFDMLQEKYKVDDKTKLTDEQAAEFLGTLQSMI